MTKKTASKKTTKKTTRKSNDAPAMLLLKLELTKLGTAKRGDLGSVKTDADKDLLRLSKRLLDCDEMTAIKRLDADVAFWVRSRSLPSLFKSGLYQIKPEAVKPIEEFLAKKRDEREALVASLVKVYGKQRKSDQERLGSQFNENDYPTAKRLPTYFNLEWRFMTIGAPDSLKKVSPEIFERERQRVIDLIEEAKTEGVALLRAGFQELIDHMIDRLTPDSDGKPKRFHASNIENINEFIDTFSIRDVADDKELKKLLSTTKSLLNGADPKKIRKDESIRENMREKFEALKKSVDPLVKAAPSRKLDPSAFGG